MCDKAGRPSPPLLPRAKARIRVRGTLYGGLLGAFAPNLRDLRIAHDQVNG